MEDIGSSFFIDVSTHIQNNTASHARRQQSSVTGVIRNVTVVRWARHRPHACKAERHRDMGLNYASSIARTGQWQNNNNTNYYPCFLLLFMYLPLYQNNCYEGRGVIQVQNWLVMVLSVITPIFQSHGCQQKTHQATRQTLCGSNSQLWMRWCSQIPRCWQGHWARPEHGRTA